MSYLQKESNKQTGFTLIELLVVIAIIGILSSVVLTSLQDARVSAKEAAIIQEARTMMTMSEIVYSQTGSYQAAHAGKVDGTGTYTCNNKFNSDPHRDDLRKICQSILDGGGKFFAGAVTARTSINNYTPDYNQHSIMILLPSSTNDWICIGSNGNTFRGTLGSNGNNFWDDSWDPPHPPGCPYNP